MQLPVIRGVIDRRILVNYRVDPGVLAALLPAPFRPKLVAASGMVGRLPDPPEARCGPRFLPPLAGDLLRERRPPRRRRMGRGGRRREGVFVPRRDTDSRLNRLGGRAALPRRPLTTPAFTVRGDGRPLPRRPPQRRRRTSLSVVGGVNAAVAGGVGLRLARGGLRLLRGGLAGVLRDAPARPARGAGAAAPRWRVEPLAGRAGGVQLLRGPVALPAGVGRVRLALLMRGIDHEWHVRGELVGREPQLTR